MAGYLDQYGAGEDRRIRIYKTLAITFVSLLIVAGVSYYIFHNYRQEREIKSFVSLLQQKDYQGAYNLWARTEGDRKDYPYESFLQDWGPQGRHNDLSQVHITRSRSCGNGVILVLDFGKDEPERLFVKRDDLSIGFWPMAGCPAPPR